MASILENEISSQPEVVARLLDRELAAIQRLVAQLSAFEYVLIAARGSSDHAALYAQYVWAALAGHTVALAAPSLFTLYARPPRLAGALVVGISQSGQSPDIVAVVDEGRRQGRPTIAITNDGASPLATAAEYVIELHAGQERSIAATKTYTAELAVVAALAATWNGAAAHQDELRRLPEAMGATLDGSAGVAGLAARYKDLSRSVVIGRGYNYATAFEVGLKLQELTAMLALPYSSADFRHGPIAATGVGSPALLIMPTGQTFADMLDLALALQQREAELLVISDAPKALALGNAALALAVSVPEWLSPITTVLPGQALALQLALAKGLDPDAPAGLRKVTQTY